MKLINMKVTDLTEAQAKQMLEDIIEKLDELDEEDYFGSEGWRHYFGFED